MFSCGGRFWCCLRFWNQNVWHKNVTVRYVGFFGGCRCSSRCSGRCSCGWRRGEIFITGRWERYFRCGICVLRTCVSQEDNEKYQEIILHDALVTSSDSWAAQTEI